MFFNLPILILSVIVYLHLNYENNSKKGIVIFFKYFVLIDTIAFPIIAYLFFHFIYPIEKEYLFLLIPELLYLIYTTYLNCLFLKALKNFNNINDNINCKNSKIKEIINIKTNYDNKQHSLNELEKSDVESISNKVNNSNKA